MATTKKLRRRTGRNLFVISIMSVAILVLSFLPVSASACQPCRSKLNLEQSLERADVVIVGRRTDYSLKERRPATINVQVLQVLKGKAISAQIAVRSWYGMCAYGIVVDSRTYLMILKNPARMPGAYTAVHGGCSVKALPLSGNRVIAHRRSLSLKEIAAMIARRR